MMQKLTATLGCLILSCALYAQSGWLPPVTFPANTYVCDPAAWKLVFYDDFNGTTLSEKWTTEVRYDEAYVWRGGLLLQTAEHGNHLGARMSAGPSIFKDENIIVGGGICKMLQYYDPNISWTVRDSTISYYPDTTQYADFSTAIIRLPQEGPDRVRKGYSSGRFQARMKMPNFNGAWPAFWMWYGRGGVNEIDITEAWAGSGLHPVHFNTVAWWLKRSPNDNPYNLPESVSMNNIYPYQNWYNYLFRSVPSVKYLNKEDWHIYTCTWDTASISYQLNNETPNTIWKYSTKKTKTKWYGVIPVQYSVTLGSGCVPDGNVNSWGITYGYPWNNDTANCDVRIASGYTSRAQEHRNTYGNNKHLLGTLEVDYVKIWQRHPEKDNHTELCAANTYPATPAISGPDEVCGQVAYTLSPATTGTWSTFDSDVLAVGTTTSSGASVAKDAGPAFNNGWVAFSYGNGIGDCPLKTVYKRGLYCNRSTDWMVMSPYVRNNNGEGRFHFISELYYKRDVSGSTTPVVTWSISINKEQDSYDARTAENYILYGQYASTPAFTVSGNQSYNLRWTMQVTDASGTWSRSGERNSKTALYQQRDDTNTYYLNAYIDDQDYYDTTVYYSVASHMVSEEEYNDTLYMNEMVEKIRAAALEPYIITDGMASSMNKGASGLDKPGDEGGLSALKSKLKVYPNPVRSNITIVADSRFSDGQAITLHIYDLAGKLIKTHGLHYTKGNIMTYDLSDIAAGNYLLKLQQGNINEHIKITKAKY